MTIDRKLIEQQQADIKLCGMLKSKYELALSFYQPLHRRMRTLDKVDSGEFWSEFGKRFPKYQLLPDTNFVSYIKSNLVASIYTVTKGANLQPTSEDDKELITKLNIALERVWDLSRVGFYQYQAGNSAALHNLGVTWVGWNDSLSGGKSGSKSFFKGNVTLKNVHPLKFMRDPFASDLDTAGYCMTYDKYHKSFFEEDDRYRDAFKLYLQLHRSAGPMTIPEDTSGQALKESAGSDKDYYTLIIFWVKGKDGKINEYHTINCEFMLYKKLDIQPRIFPFALLYCNEPGEKVIGVSEPMRILANNIAYNLMDSIALTSEYKNQRPPKFVNTQSGLNIQEFAKSGDEADRTFIVNGDASKAVHYHQFPQISPHLISLKMGLQQGIETVTGVDQKYTGRNTGSVITTGGVESMLNRVTVIDTPKIAQYEWYTRRLTELVLFNLIHFCPKRSYFVKKPNSRVWQTVEVDFPKIDNDTLFGYSMNISSELPKNKERVADMANMLMEKQMQYQKEGTSVDLITEEEWLMFQDLPNKEFMLERMGIQRDQDAVTQTTQVLFNYANLVKNGMDPNDAILATANNLKNTQMGMPMNEGVDTAMMGAQQPPMSPPTAQPPAPSPSIL